jgi:hypothetical protein
VCEGCSLELGVLHMPTLTPVGCGLLLYNSYSLRTKRALYNDMRADGLRLFGVLRRPLREPLAILPGRNGEVPFERSAHAFLVTEAVLFTGQTAYGLSCE